eukprot:CAMPEP_0172806368 /NCGR_PEP_ID=MMETSP1075-20121228/6316_1 /TAXON_ID=2916 /ORGANISM="Ceratium fusus, Strain PA161109" /LENGTH=201 /DNA_ID=CAMNT_0013645157 /DNA_START=15 /DNA_END=621 /DNA_ORIENTATION=-
MPPAATAAAMFADDQACHSTLWQSTQQGHGVRTPGYHCSRSSLTSTSFVFWATVPHQRVRNADFLVMAAAPSASRCSFSNVSRSVAFSAESMEQQETHIEEEDAKAETATTHADVAKAAAEKATEATDKAVEDAEWASDASDWVLTVNFAAMSLVLGIGFKAGDFTKDGMHTSGCFHAATSVPKDARILMGMIQAVKRDQR